MSGDAHSADEEALYERGVAIVLEHAKASVSWLQRQLRIGYNSAVRLVERMEREGFVSAPDHVGRRAVLRPPSSTMPGSSVSPPEVNAWERRAGAFGAPSTIVPIAEREDDTPPAVAGDVMAATTAGSDTLLVETAVELVRSLGLEGARRAVRAAADDAGESETFRQPKAKSDHLTAIVERAEHLFGERDMLAQDIRDLFKFAKDIGLDAPAIRKVIRDRAMDQDKRFTAEATYAVYRHAMAIEDPDFTVELPAPSIPPPVRGRKLTAKEKQYQETLASVAASRAVLVQ